MVSIYGVPISPLRTVLKAVCKEVGEEERGAQGGVDRRSDNATSVDVEIDPHCRRLGRSQTDFALQAIVECRAAKAK